MADWKESLDKYITSIPDGNTDCFCDECKNECGVIQICSECLEEKCTCGTEDMTEVSECCHADVVPYEDVEEDWELEAAEHKWEADNER